MCILKLFLFFEIFCDVIQHYFCTWCEYVVLFLPFPLWFCVCILAPYNIITPGPANIDTWHCYRVSCCLELLNRKQNTCHEWRREKKWLRSVSQSLHQVVMQGPSSEYAFISRNSILVTCYMSSYLDTYVNKHHKKLVNRIFDTQNVNHCISLTYNMMCLHLTWWEQIFMLSSLEFHRTENF
jgi:hypothetical protein